jgi:MoaA/NifB/PqqE/SkfB family radical SAM enzyme
VIAEAGKQSAILFPIFTNGTAMQEQDYTMLDTHRNLIPILSVEGDETATDNRRGSGVHTKLTDTMRKLADIKLLFGASITVTNANLNNVTDAAFVDGLFEKGCKIIFYVEYIPFDAGIQALSETERGVLEKKIAELRKKDMIFVSFPGDEKGSDGCLAAGRGFFHISANGDAEPCPFSPYSDTNLRDLPLKEALQSPLFRKIISGDVLRGEHKGGCTLFEQKELVEGLLR